MSRIFHVDLDGTLLTTEKTIGEATRNAIREFTRAGNYFVINTGRALTSAQKVFKLLDISPENCFLACFNGTCIYDCERDRIIYQCKVPRRVAADIFDMAREDGIYLQTYENDEVICEEPTECTDFYCFRSKMAMKAVGRMGDYLTGDVSKILLIELHDFDRSLGFAERVKAIYGDQLYVLPSSKYLYEIFSREGGKGNAVTRLCELLEVPLSDSIAAGDEQNDLSMLRAAGFSIAVQNAVEIVKTSVDEVATGDNDHDALAPYFRRLL